MVKPTLRPTVRWSNGVIGLIFAVLPLLSMSADVDRRTETGSKTVIGVRNLALKDGAEALLSGRFEEGVRLTHQGQAPDLDWLCERVLSRNSAVAEHGSCLAGAG